MMKKSVLTRVLCILLLLSLVAAFAACEETGETSGAVSTPSETTSETSEAPLFSNLPETTYGGVDFVILVNGDCYDQYASATFLQYWKNSYGDVLSGSSQTAPFSVLPIFLPSEFNSRVIVIA